MTGLKRHKTLHLKRDSDVKTLYKFDLEEWVKERATETNMVGQNVFSRNWDLRIKLVKAR